MRLNQVEPIRQAIFGGRLALERHAVALPNSEALLDRGASPVEHHPAEQPKIELFGLEEDPSVGLGCASVKGKRVVVIEVIQRSLLPERGSLKAKGNFCPKTNFEQKLIYISY